MSLQGPEDRVALVRRVWASYDAGDLDSVLAAFDPNVEVHTSPEMANAGTFTGRAEFVRWLDAWNEAWESFDTRLVEIEPSGERHVVVCIQQTGIGRGSGVEVSMRVGWLFEVREERCVHIGLHPSFEQALAVAGDREGLQADAGA